MLTAAAAVALAFWLGQPRVNTQTFTAPAAQRQAMALADGTQVEINARTQLNILISANERRAQLNNGEAFFAVARDSKRPFVVETPAGSVQVLGTKFNVRTASDGTLDVAVVEGLVKVRPANAAADDQPITLPAGTRYHRGMVATISRAETDTLLAWRQGQVVFYDVSLDEALAHVARYHDRKIVVSAAAAAERPGGRFGIDNLEEFLANLEAAIGVEAVHQSDGTILVRKAGER